MRRHIEVLASDEFGGRFPGTDGETRTLTYLARQWAEAGWVSGTEDPEHPWFQPVGLIERGFHAQAVEFRHRGHVMTLLASQIVLRSSGARAEVSDAPLIYAGYGVDGAGRVIADIAGKIVLIRYSDPDYGSGSPDLFALAARRRALVAAGAAAVLAIADQPRTPFSWLRRQARTQRIDLASRDRGVSLDGVVSDDFAELLFGRVGRSLSGALSAARLPDYAGISLDMTGSLAVTMIDREFTSHNIIAKLPGRLPGAGAVLLLGHWDHLGECGRPEAEDRICNGAVDNASGMAVLTEVARRLAAGPRLDRDIYLMGTTAEEQGLLGTYAFAEGPPVPLERIVVALNVDMVAIAPRGANLVTIGRGETDLDPHVDRVGRQLGRTIDESTDANSFLGRQDGWALASKGVPALMVGSAFADKALLNEYLEGDYHGPGDELHADLELGGAADDADLHVALARYFATVQTFP